MSGPRTVVFRADMSREIGTGHVRRCLALADALRSEGVDTLFVTRDLGLPVAAEINQAGHRCIMLPAPELGFSPADDAPRHARWGGVPQMQDAAETTAALGRQEVFATVIDHYAFDARWHFAARQWCDRRVVIDDLADRSIAADMIVDHNPDRNHAAKYAGRIEQPVRVLGGPRYALLGAAYRHVRHNPAGDPVRSIGVFMGGGDAARATDAILDALTAVGFTGDVEAVVPRGWQIAARHLAMVGGPLWLVHDLPDLSCFFARHELHIGAGGGATWERFRIGAPTIAIACADNQRAVLRQLRDGGYQFGVDQLDPVMIGRELAACLADHGRRRHVAAAARRLVDGLGSERVAKAILCDSIGAAA